MALTLVELTVQAAIKSLLKQGHFSICDLDNICNLIEVQPRGKAYAMLKALHCVHYRDMDEALVAAIPRLIDQVLGVSFTLNVVQPEKDVTPARSFLERIGVK